MAAGLGYKEFTTGDVLTAADANGYLASQVVMVFASAAARTSAIASPQEGMISYLKDTNSTEYYSGSAWAAIGAASASGLELITRQTYTTASTINVNDVFSATYENYKVIIQNSASTAGDLSMRLRVSGADNTSAVYSSTMQEGIDGTTNIFGRYEVNSTSWINADIGFKADLAMTMDFVNPFLTQYTQVLGIQAQSYSGYRGGAFNMIHTGATSFTGFSFYTGSGSATGVVSVYGYKK